MLNQVVTVGRLKEIKESEIVVSIARRDEEDLLVTFQVKGSIMENLKEYCTINDLLGIKGHLIENNQIEVEKLTFLTANKNKKEDE